MVAGVSQNLFGTLPALYPRSGLLSGPLPCCQAPWAAGSHTIALTLLGRAFATDELPSANTAFTMIWEVGAIGGPIIGGVAMQAEPAWDAGRAPCRAWF